MKDVAEWQPTEQLAYRDGITFIHECPTCGVIHENHSQSSEACESHRG